MAQPWSLWVLPTSALGGVARHALDVARAGIPGYRLAVLAPPGPLLTQLGELGVPTIEAEIGPDHGLRASRASLQHAVDALAPAVVHSHLAYADVVTALVRTPGVRISTEHGIAADDLVYHGSRARAAVMARAHQVRTSRFAALIAVAEATRAAMQAKWHPRTPITLIRNGIDPVPTAPQPGLRIASIARLAPEKRIDHLLRAYAQLDMPDATLTIAGTGPLEGELKTLADRLGITVDFPGHADATELLGRTDVLVQLSVWENCSYSLLDAAVRGIGIVASPVGGNPEIVPDRCLVDPTDHAAVAAAIRAQGTGPALRPALADWPTVADMCADIAMLYDDTLQRPVAATARAEAH